MVATFPKTDPKINTVTLNSIQIVLLLLLLYNLYLDIFLHKIFLGFHVMWSGKAWGVFCLIWFLQKCFPLSRLYHTGELPLSLCPMMRRKHCRGSFTLPLGGKSTATAIGNLRSISFLCPQKSNYFPPFCGLKMYNTLMFTCVDLFFVCFYMMSEQL